MASLYELGVHGGDGLCYHGEFNESYIGLAHLFRPPWDWCVHWVGVVIDTVPQHGRQNDLRGDGHVMGMVGVELAGFIHGVMHLRSLTLRGAL